MQEATEILQNTDEKITLEVHREKPSCKAPRTSNAATQTESSWWNKQCFYREDFTPAGCDLFLGRSDYNFLLPQDRDDNTEPAYLPTAPHDMEDKDKLDYEEPDLRHQNEWNFSSCYTTPNDNYSICLSVTEEEQEAEHTFLLPHDWDSGVGCTDGSTHLDENSGPDIDAECLYIPKRERVDPSAGGTSANSQLPRDNFLTYDELSDSSFYSISPEEYRKFQEILERKCHQYQLFKALNRDQESPCTLGNEEEKPEQSTLQDQWLEGLSTMSQGTSHKTGAGPQNAVNGVGHGDNSTKGQKDPEPVPLTPPNAAGPDALVIPYHTRHYVSYMNLVQEDTTVECLSGEPRSSMLSHQCSEAVQGKTDVRTEWSLTCKRHRHLLSKQHKSQLLKNRALRIVEERGGMTTDDDALSELKTGKYWNKAERRQHLILSRQQKQRKEFMMQSRMQQLQEDNREGTEGRRDLSIIELSQKKLMKKRNKRVLDNWITIQELLSHGTKSQDGRITYNPLLSVTTV